MNLNNKDQKALVSPDPQCQESAAIRIYSTNTFGARLTIQTKKKDMTPSPRYSTEHGAFWVDMF